MNEKNQLKKRIKFYLVGSNILAGSFAIFLLGLFAPLIYIVIWPLVLLAFTFALVLFVNALITFSKAGRIYPSLKDSAMFGGIAAAAYPALCIVFAFTVGSNQLGVIPNEIYWAVLLTLNPITFAIGLAAIHAVIMRRINKVVVADLAQVSL